MKKLEIPKNVKSWNNSELLPMMFSKINEICEWIENNQRWSSVQAQDLSRLEEAQNNTLENCISYYTDGKRFDFQNSEDFDKFYDKTNIELEEPKEYVVSDFGGSPTDSKIKYQPKESKCKHDFDPYVGFCNKCGEDKFFPNKQSSTDKMAGQITNWLFNNDYLVYKSEKLELENDKDFINFLDQLIKPTKDPEGL